MQGKSSRHLRVAPASLLASSDTSDGGAPLCTPTAVRFENCLNGVYSSSDVESPKVMDENGGFDTPRGKPKGFDAKSSTSPGSRSAAEQELATPRASSTRSGLNPSTKPFVPSFQPSQGSLLSVSMGQAVACQTARGQRLPLMVSLQQQRTIVNMNSGTPKLSNKRDAFLAQDLLQNQYLAYQLGDPSRNMTGESKYPQALPGTFSASSRGALAHGGIETQRHPPANTGASQDYVEDRASGVADHESYLERQEYLDGHFGTEGRSSMALQDLKPHLGPFAPVDTARNQASTALQSKPQQPLLLNTPLIGPTGVFDVATPAVKAQRSDMLNAIAGDKGVPSLADLMNPANFPFEEPALRGSCQEHGVVHLRNIPYNVTQPEIIALLGRNSKMLNDKQEPVHIMMDRVSSKTNDAYIEFMTLDDAVMAVNRHKNDSARGRPARLGDRPVEVVVASQAQLMKDLFPAATGVVWHGSRPEISPFNPSEPWRSFKSFVTEEEMSMLTKHVEVPTRSQHSHVCPERPYESLISTIKKMPWHMTEYITMKQRHSIYDAVCRLVAVLKHAIQLGTHEVRLTPQLLKRLTNAAVLCPGFTVLQKDNVAQLVSMDEHDLSKYLPTYPDLWCHQYALAPKANIPRDVVEYYIAIIRQETQDAVAELNIREKQDVMARGRLTSDYWGYFWREVNYASGPEFDNMTLAQAAATEWAAVDGLLRRAINRAAAHGGARHVLSGQRSAAGHITY